MSVLPFRSSQGRTLICRFCGCKVQVFEVPKEHLDADAYVCGDCLLPVGKPRLRLVKDD